MEEKRYFIFNLGSLHSPDLKDRLTDYFSKFGEVKDVFIRDNKGFGFVNLASEELLPNDHDLDGHAFKTDLAKPKGVKTGKLGAQRYFLANLATLETKLGDNINSVLKTYFENHGAEVKEVFFRRGKGFAFVSATGLEPGFLHKRHEIEGVKIKVDAAKPQSRDESRREEHGVQSNEIPPWARERAWSHHDFHGSPMFPRGMIKPNAPMPWRARYPRHYDDSERPHWVKREHPSWAASEPPMRQMSDSEYFYEARQRQRMRRVAHAHQGRSTPRGDRAYTRQAGFQPPHSSAVEAGYGSPGPRPPARYSAY